MKMWDFTDNSFLIFFIIIISLILIVLTVGVSVLISYQRDAFYRKNLDADRNSTRVYVIDLKNNEVTYFNRSNIRLKRKMDLADFYASFHPNDMEKLRNWIFSICNDYKTADQFLEADVYVNRRHNSYFSLLKLIKYNPDNNLIHVESIILKYITPINFSSKKKNSTNGVVKRSVIAGMINKSKSLHGFTFAIRFFYMKQKALFNDRIEKNMTMTLKNEIYPFAMNSKSPRLIMDASESEMMLFDLKIENKEIAMRLANSMAKSLKKCLTINGFDESLSFAIGVVANGEYYQDFDAIYEKAEQACIVAEQNGEEVYLTQRSGSQMIELNKYTLEVEHLFDKDALRYLYRPIIQATNQRTIGYFEYVRAYDSPFNNLNEMSKYAEGVGKSKQLFAMVCKRILPKFASEKPNQNCRLFLNVSMIHLPYLHEVLSQISSVKLLRLVLVFDEQEISASQSETDYLIEEIKQLKTENFEIGVLLPDKDLLLDPKIYSYFDYFIAGANTLGEIKKNNRIRLSIHVLIERLLKYRKPIIATDLESWQSIELIMKSGIDYLSSEIISPSNDMLLPVDKKKKEKIVAFAEKYCDNGGYYGKQSNN